MIDEALDRAHRGTRLVLELASLASADAFMKRSDPSRLERLQEIANRFAWTIENAEFGEIDLANHDFGREMAALSDNPVMARIINEIREVVLPSSRNPWSSIRGLKASADEHFEMIEHLRAKDLDALGEVLQRHMFRWQSDDRTERQTADAPTPFERARTPLDRPSEKQGVERNHRPRLPPSRPHCATGWRRSHRPVLNECRHRFIAEGRLCGPSDAQP